MTHVEFAKGFSFSFRSLRNDRGYFAAATITMALGLGLTTAVFSVVDAVLLRSLPYRSPSSLVMLWGTSSKGKSAGINCPAPPLTSSMSASNRNPSRAWPAFAAPHLL